MSWLMFLASVFAYVWLKPVSVSFLDVGQGDACLIQGGFGGNVLIDGGDEGSGITLNGYLAKQNVRKLDAVFLSHFHEDHALGILELLGSGFAVEQIYLSTIPSYTEMEEELLNLAKEANIPITRLGIGDSVTHGKVRYDVIWPTERAQFMKMNNQSLVLRAAYGENRMLFTGDIEMSAQSELALEHKEKLTAQILKVPHHGGSSSAHMPFLTAVHPRFAVIGVGVNNYYEHPHPKMLDNLDAIGAQVLRTDKDGTVRVVLGKNKIKRIETTEKWRKLQ
ncbi:MAG: MBL fold metallo-hydrolase [Clostridia bacterium]|nr:MBL fold metallo-hydrolase [Clostridia bacterium]